MSAALPVFATGTVRQRVHWSERIAHAALAAVVLALLAFLAAPLAAILTQSVEGSEGEFVGLRNFIAYASTPALLDSLADRQVIGLQHTAAAREKLGGGKGVPRAERQGRQAGDQIVVGHLRRVRAQALAPLLVARAARCTISARWGRRKLASASAIAGLVKSW